MSGKVVTLLAIGFGLGWSGQMDHFNTLALHVGRTRFGTRTYRA